VADFTKEREAGPFHFRDTHCTERMVDNELNNRRLPRTDEIALAGRENSTWFCEPP